MSEGPKLPHSKAESAVHPPIAFLDRTYDEALALTCAAHGCIAAGLAAPLNGAARPAAMQPRAACVSASASSYVRSRKAIGG